MAETQTSSSTVAGYFDNHSDAERAVQDLRDAGFTSAHIGVAHRGENSGSSTSSVGNAASAVGEKTEGMWNKFKNFFEGDAEPYADEQIQGELANREVTANPADSYRSGSSDDLHHNLTGLSVPEDRSRYFGSRFGGNENGAIVTVKAGDRSAEAEAILTRAGADLGHDTSKYTDNTEATPAANNLEGTQNIQLLGEILRVHKDRISRGEVTLRKEVITENQTIQVPVTREELVIERHAVGSETAARGTIGENSEIRIPLTEETASIDKSTVVREEVSVGKKTVQEVRDLSGEVRHEELAVDNQVTDTNDVTRTGSNR